MVKLKHNRILRLAALAALAALLCGCGAKEAAPEAAQETAEAASGEAVRLFAVNVGKGDALLVSAGGRHCLIDAGKAWARGRVLGAMRRLGIDALDAVFLTHGDDDHADGLDWLARGGIPVGTWYAPGIFEETTAEKHPAARAAALRGADVVWLRRGDSVPLGDGGAVFRVLAPSVRFFDKDDNNSLVLMLETGEGRMLFTGDMELPQEAVLLEAGDDLSCAVLKAPNHGDDDTLSAAFAKAAGAQIAVISTDSGEKPGTPDPGVVSRLKAAGSACWVTQEAALGVEVTLSGGRASARNVDIDAPAQGGVGVAAVVPGDDLITIAAQADVDLTDWYLHSSRGDELYVFPEGFSLAAGQTVVIGSRASPEGACALLWDDKRVAHQSKADVITLYDPWGRAVDSRSNGF